MHIAFNARFTNVHSSTSLTFLSRPLRRPRKKTNETYTQSSECRLHQRCAAHISGVPLTSAVCRSHQRCAASISGVPLTSAVCRLHQRCAAYTSGVPLTSAVCRLKQLHCIVWRGGVPLEATPFSGVPLASAVCRFCVCMDLQGQDYDIVRTRW